MVQTVKSTDEHLKTEATSRKSGSQLTHLQTWGITVLRVVVGVVFVMHGGQMLTLTRNRVILLVSRASQWAPVVSPVPPS